MRTFIQIVAFCFVIAVVSAIAAWIATPFARAAPTPGRTKAKVDRLDALPRASFRIAGTVEALVTSREAFDPLSRELRADLTTLLETYEITEYSTLMRIEATLLALDWLDGRMEALPAHVDRLRELEQKPTKKLTAGLIADAYVRAVRRTGGQTAGDGFSLAVREEMTRLVAALPWETVQEEIEALKGQIDILSPNIVLAVVRSQLEPVVAKSGELTRDLAQQVVELRLATEVVVPIKEAIVGALGDAIAQNRVERPDIWASRNVVLETGAAASTVVVGIWDTGVDLDVYPDRLFTYERGAGAPTEIDDRHGIAWTVDHVRTPDLLYPLGEAAPRLPDMERRIKGYFDLQAAIDSPEAREAKTTFSTLEPDAMKDVIEDLGRYTLYCHGTHVAGIAVEGNPFARIVVGRLTADLRMIPAPPSIEDAKGAAIEYRDTIDYFKRCGARVVNMSWGLPLQHIEQGLELNGIGETAEARAALAREIFEIHKAALYAALKGAPEILFVGGAGNSDNDVAFDEFIPPAFDLPNLLIAGAVDRAGDPARFTSFGPRTIYSNGVEVPSYVPGGKRMALSGTSMAAPNVTNLAAKLFAIDPSLTPARAAELVRTGCDRAGKDPKLPLIHPAHTIELLRAARGS